jgi:hypothetical protein
MDGNARLEDYVSKKEVVALRNLPGPLRSQLGQLLRSRMQRKRKPSISKTIQAVRKAGVDKGNVTIGEVSVTFGESDPTAAVDPWLADIDEVTKQ